MLTGQHFHRVVLRADVCSRAVLTPASDTCKDHWAGHGDVWARRQGWHPSPPGWVAPRGGAADAHPAPWGFSCCHNSSCIGSTMILTPLCCDPHVHTALLQLLGHFCPFVDLLPSCNFSAASQGHVAVAGAQLYRVRMAGWLLKHVFWGATKTGKVGESVRAAAPRLQEAAPKKASPGFSRPAASVRLKGGPKSMRPHLLFALLALVVAAASCAPDGQVGHARRAGQSALHEASITEGVRSATSRARERTSPGGALRTVHKRALSRPSAASQSCCVGRTFRLDCMPTD